MIRWTITGTAASTSARVRSIVRSVSSGSKRRRSTIVEAVGRLITKWKKPQEWNSGAAIIIVGPERKGILSITAARTSRPSGLVRWAPLGVPVVPEVRITKRGLSGGGVRSPVSPSAIRPSSVDLALRRGAVVPGDDPLHAGLDAAQQVAELLVVDQRLRPLALHHLGQLRAGEHRVEVERRGAELGRRQGRLEEAAVVAGHDPDPVAGADPRARGRSGRGRWSGGAGAPRRARRVRRGSRSRAGARSPRWRRRSPARRPSAGRSSRPCIALSGRSGARIPASRRTFASNTRSETAARTLCLEFAIEA